MGPLNEEVLITLLPETLVPPTATSKLQHLNTWVQDCISSHPTCRPPASLRFRYPTRLLCVNQPGDTHIHLIETTTTTTTTPISGPYNVLSYRWGAFQPVKLLKLTRPTFLTTGIPISSLPQTLMDAITTTRAMSISFLWIDALCIIQDSPADWASEARTMADVYGHAHLSLAASHNIDSTGGLFPKRSGSSRGQPIPIRFPTNPEWALPHHDFQLVEHNFWNNRVEDAPLNTRGWVVQERILAPRTVHFGFDGPLFECRETRLSLTRLDLSIGQSARRLILPVRARLERRPRAFAKYWAAVVQYYTGRDLSFGSDRPVAIAGIARALQAVAGKKMEYMAGMWSRGLLRWLLWEAAERGGGEAGRYRAPSWSWLAVEGRVFYDTDLIQGFRYLKTGAHAKVVKWRLVTGDGTEFGAMTAGYLQLRVVLIPVDIEKDGTVFDARLGGESLSGTGLGRWILEGHLSWSWDAELDEAMVRRNNQQGGSIFAMPIMETAPTKSSEDVCLYALLIERVNLRGQNDVYRRVGILTVFGTTREAKADEVLDRDKAAIRLI